MRLSEGIEWGAHVCTVLAHLPPDQTLPASALAEYHGIPAPYLSKHLQALSRADVVESRPGPRGGFRLARPAAEITLLDVVLAIEGDEAAFRCSEIRQRGPAAVDDPDAYRSPCGIAAAMWRAEDSWRAELASVTIADLADLVMRTVHPDQIEASITWLSDVITRRSAP